MTWLFVITSYFPLGESTGAPLALSCASPVTRTAVEWMCTDGFTSPHLSVKLCQQQPYVRRAIRGLTKPEHLQTHSSLYFGRGRSGRSCSPTPAGAEPQYSSSRNESGGLTGDHESRWQGPVASLPPFVCGGLEMAGAPPMTAQKQHYPLQLPSSDCPATHTRTVRIEGTKLPRTLHAAVWWLRRNEAAVPIALVSPFMRGRLAVYPLLEAKTMELLSLPEFFDDRNQAYLLAHNAELRARFVEFAGPVLPFLVDVELPECRRTIDPTPLSGAVNMVCFSVSGDGLYNVDFLKQCHRLEYVNVSASPHLTDLSPLTSSEEKCQRLSSVAAAGTGITDTSHFLSARCTALAYLDLSRCAQLTEFDSLGTLSALRQLNLSHTCVSGLAWVRGCAQLEELYLVQCTQVTDLSPLSDIKYLEVLDASGCSVHSLDWLSNGCLFLYRLHLDACRYVRDWTPVAAAMANGSLSWLSVAGCGPFGDLNWLSSPSADTMPHQDGLAYRLRVLNVANCDQLADLSALRGATALTTLNISGTAVRDLRWLPSCRALRDLNLSKCPHIVSYAPLYAAARHLCAVNLSWCTLASPKPELLEKAAAAYAEGLGKSQSRAVRGGEDGAVSTSPSLPLFPIVDLDVSNCKNLTTLSAVTAVAGRTLEHISVAASSISNVDWLTPCTALRVLHLSHCNRLPRDVPLDLSPLTHSANTLLELNVSYTTPVSDLSVLRACVQLERLNVANCTRLADLSPIASLVRLELLNLSGCSAVTSLEPLRACSRLRQLNVSQCTAVQDFSPLGHLQDLRRLDASATQLDTIAWIGRCRALEEVNVSRCPQLNDIEALGKLPNLARLNIVRSGVLEGRGVPVMSAAEDVEVLSSDSTRSGPTTTATPRASGQTNTCQIM